MGVMAMSDPMDRAWQSARADVDSVVLAAPEALRRAGTRRTRMKVVTVAFAAVIVITGASIGTNQYFQRTAPVVGETPSPAPSLPRPSSARPTPPVELMTPPDPCSTDVKQCYPPGILSWFEKMPAPCTTTEHPSERKVLKRHAGERSAMFVGTTGEFVPDASVPVVGPATTMYGATFTRYSTDGASQYLAEIRAAVNRCPSVSRLAEEGRSQRVTWRYRVVSTNTLGGSESLLLSRTYYRQAEVESSIPAGDVTYLIAVVRVFDTIVVVVDHGWESSPSIRKTFDGFVAYSIEQATAF
jgi:hypothetical protein